MILPPVFSTRRVDLRAAVAAGGTATVVAGGTAMAGAVVPGAGPFLRPTADVSGGGQTEAGGRSTPCFLPQNLREFL